MSFDWSGQQQQAIQEVDTWLKDPTRQVFYLAGYAGTGKTTLAQHLAGDQGLVLFAAFTGKAASVLRKKGAPEASTLHSILYDVSDADKTKLREIQRRLAELLQQTKAPGIDGETALMLSGEIEQLEKDLRAERIATRGPRFRLNEESIMVDADLLVLDECSMVDERLGKDALSFGKKVLVLGDPAQLPPVKGKGYFTNREPDLLLTEIHRQARDNPIIRAATAVRERRPIPYGDWGDVAHIPRKDVTQAIFLPEQVDAGAQVLCGKNKTRRKINRHIRRVRGHDSPYPEDGETLVVLKNDSEMGVLNGVVCLAASHAEDDPDDPENVHIRLDYEGEIIPSVPMDRMPFDIYRYPELEEEYSPSNNRHSLHADWGYALTVHKSQGSEWDRVLLIDDGFGNWRGADNLRAQWLYTAITRASKQLVILS